MKTFEELKKNRLVIEERKLSEASKKLEDSNIDWYKKFNNNEQKRKSLEVIGNIDEAVKMEIAMYANILYDGLMEISEHDFWTDAFYINFKKCINIAETIFKDSDVYLYELDLFPLYPRDVVRAIMYFGWTQDDLQNIMYEKINIRLSDNFIKFINGFYGTSMPLYSEWVEFRLSPIPTLGASKDQYMYKYHLMKLRNGEFMDGNYPEQYESDILKIFDKNITVKRLMNKK